MKQILEMLDNWEEIEFNVVALTSSNIRHPWVFHDVRIANFSRVFRMLLTSPLNVWDNYGTLIAGFGRLVFVLHRLTGTLTAGFVYIILLR